MKVLVIGGGGREHAIIKKLRENPDIKEIFCSTGNAGINSIASSINIPWEKDEDLIQLIRYKKIDFVVIAPEAPSAGGFVDKLKLFEIPCFGVNKNAARLESSKAFSKELMTKNNILTGACKIYNFARENELGEYEVLEKDIENIKLFCKKMSYPLVIKADGLAAGKGVYIANDKCEIDDILNELLKLKSSASKLVIEEYLDGYEVSVFAFCDGNTILPTITSQDHKAIYEGGEGPNTGGMGAVAPINYVSDEMMNIITDKIFYPLLSAFQREHINYQGIIYAGIMIVDDQPYVLEFNVRFGDPETQVILPLLETDLFEIMQAISKKELHKIKLNWKNKSAACVVASSEGYPGSYKKCKVITGLDYPMTDDSYVIHAGTKVDANNNIVTDGGRVLNTVGIGDNLAEALNKAYNLMDKIHFEGKHFRKDIGKFSLNKEM